MQSKRDKFHPFMKGARSAIGRILLGILVIGAASSCNWASLAANALTYRTTASGEAANVAVNGTVAYVSLAEKGLGITDLETGKSIGTLPSPAGSESIDDVAIADNLLFALDARPPGHLSVFSLAVPAAPALVSGPVPVAVGPFSGVSAAAGRLIVSGGTSELSLRTYDRNGKLGTESAVIDLGRGQPDVLISPDGKRAFVSTHYWGPYFGLTVLRIDSDPLSLTKIGQVDLDGAGFTAGGAKPANFPIEMATDGNLLLVAFAEGLTLFDISKEGAPKLVKSVRLETASVNVDLRDGVAAVVGSTPEPRLTLIDVAKPEEAKVLRSIALPSGSYATGVALGHRRVVVAAHEKGSLLLDR
jgi:hypothetical protein